ncbi:hypothetical protein ACWCZ5_34930, partial [Streptomyces sp. NPDC001667]
MTREHYEELVELGRDWVAAMSSVQWRIGDAALEIEPMRAYGGANPSGKDDLFTVSEAIRLFARPYSGPSRSTCGCPRHAAPWMYDRADLRAPARRLGRPPGDRPPGRG